MEQKNLNENEIKTIHVLLAILLDDNNVVSLSFEQLNINYETVIEEYEKYLVNQKHYNKRIIQMLSERLKNQTA